MVGKFAKNIPYLFIYHFIDIFSYLTDFLTVVVRRFVKLTLLDYS